jgi:hypothetical protein
MSRVSARERGRVSAHAVTFPGVQRLQRSAHRRLHPYTVRALAVTGMHGYNGAHIGGYARTRCARWLLQAWTVTTERTSAVTPAHGARVGCYRRGRLQRSAHRRLHPYTVRALAVTGVQRLQQSAHQRLHPYTVRALALTGVHGYNGARVGGYRSARLRGARVGP